MANIFGDLVSMLMSWPLEDEQAADSRDRDDRPELQSDEVETDVADGHCARPAPNLRSEIHNVHAGI